MYQASSFIVLVPHLVLSMQLILKEDILHYFNIESFKYTIILEFQVKCNMYKIGGKGRVQVRPDLVTFSILFKAYNAFENVSPATQNH